MRLALALCALLAAHASAQTAVVISKRGIVPAYDAMKYAEQLTGALKVAGVSVIDATTAAAQLKAAGILDTTTCAGVRTCAVDLGAKLKLENVIALTMSELGSDRSLTFEALKVSDGSLLARDVAVIEKGVGLTLDAVGQFIQKLRAALPQPKTDAVAVMPAPSDVPAKTDVTPGAPPPTMVVTNDASTRIPAYIAGGAGIAALIAGGICGAVALSSKGALESSVIDGTNSTLTLPQATALRNQANTMATVSLTTLLVGGALAAATVVLW